MIPTFRETLRKLVPVLPAERIKRLYGAYLAADGIEKREIENLIEAYAARLLNDDPAQAPAGLFPPPPPEKCLGDIDLGNVLYGGREMCMFGLRKDELLRHVGLYGSSGSGKSNGIALILDGLIQHKVPFILVDFKRTFRALLRDYPTLLVFTAGDNGTAPFHFNPLVPPPGTSIEVWTKKLIGALSHAYCQGAGSESLLISALDAAYAGAARSKRWPTFRDVAQVLEMQPARGRKGMWMDSAKRAVGSLSSGNAADAFCPEHSFDITRLLSHYVILELDLLNQAEQTFLSECLLLWLIQYRMNYNNNRERLAHSILIEEAHHLMRAPPGVGDGSEPVIHIALREVRELGECIIVATQNASVVPVSVFGNQATTLAFHTKHAKDVSSTSQAMLLKDDAKDELGRLPVGEAIVRVPRWPDAFHISLQHRPIAKGTVSDFDIRQHMHSRWYSGNTAAYHAPPPEPGSSNPIPRQDDKQGIPMESLIQTEFTSTHAPAKVAIATPTTTPTDQENLSAFPESSELELAMLRDIVERPFDGVVKRIHRLQTSRRKGSAALKALEARGLIMPANVFTGSSVIKLYDLTPQGREFCKTVCTAPLPNPSVGGVVHRYWLHCAATRLRELGWTIATEHKVSDELVLDIHAQRKDSVLAVLVETGKSHVKENIAKTIAAGYLDVCVISENPGVARIVSQAQETFPNARIKIKTPRRALE